MRRAVVLLLVLAGCASPTGKDGGGSTTVQRTRVSTSSGGALDAERAPEPPAEEDPSAPCKHAWEHVRQGTHSWVDEQEGMGMVALCTPIACRKCGEVRHECTLGRIPAR